MNEIEQIHDAAMQAFGLAMMAALRGDGDARFKHLEVAYELERQAAGFLEASYDQEPSRSVIHRSAASLALQCGKIREAERLIAQGLAGNPPEAIANELRDLLEDVYFQRHLDLRGVTLSENEIQFTIAGEGVAFGKVETNLFIGKLKAFEKLVHRTAERKARKPFRERGPAGRDILAEFETYMSAPRAASFAVSLKFGQPKGQDLLKFDGFVDGVVSEVFDCVDAVQLGNIELVRERIPDRRYFRNFIELTKQIAPGQSDDSYVGLTVQRGESLRKTAIRKSRSEISEMLQSQTGQAGRVREHLELVGQLRFADETRQDRPTIKIVDDQGDEHLVRVQAGMMGDIVKPLWDRRVKITALRALTGRGAAVLTDIEAV